MVIANGGFVPLVQQSSQNYFTPSSPFPQSMATKQEKKVVIQQPTQVKIQSSSMPMGITKETFTQFIDTSKPIYTPISQPQSVMRTTEIKTVQFAPKIEQPLQILKTETKAPIFGVNEINKINDAASGKSLWISKIEKPVEELKTWVSSDKSSPYFNKEVTAWGGKIFPIEKYGASELTQLENKNEKVVNTALYIKNLNENYNRIESDISQDPAYNTWNKMHNKYQDAVASGDSVKAETLLGDIKRFESDHKSFTDKINIFNELYTKKTIELPTVVSNLNPDANPLKLSSTTDVKNILRELGDTDFDRDARYVQTRLKQQVATSSASVALKDYLDTQKKIDKIYEEGKIEIPKESLSAKISGTSNISYTGKMPLSYLTGNEKDTNITDMNITIDRLGNVGVSDLSGKTFNKFVTSQTEANKQIDEYIKNNLSVSEYEKMSKENYNKYLSAPKGFENVKDMTKTLSEMKRVE
ncbi:MAG: hypothetical protein WC755_07955, partial [Candidatus Woesearchaeota archaeon]